MDCVLGLVAALGALLGTIVGTVVGYGIDHEQDPRVEGSALVIALPVVAIVAWYVGVAAGSAFESFVRRFRPAGEGSVTSHDARLKVREKSIDRYDIPRVFFCG